MMRKHSLLSHGSNSVQERQLLVLQTWRCLGIYYTGDKVDYWTYNHVDVCALLLENLETNKKIIIYKIYSQTLHISILVPLCNIMLLWQVINLIPFNPIGSSSDFGTSSEQKVAIFQKILRGTYEIRTTVRKQMGQDISGACGQLVVNMPNKRSGMNAAPLADIEDLHH